MSLLSRVALSLAICGMLVTTLAVPVQAAQSFDIENQEDYEDLDDDEGYVGDEVTIDGWWDDKGDDIWIYYELFDEDEDDWHEESDDSYYDSYDETRDSTRYYFELDFTIPESAQGTHDIYVCDDDDPDDRVSTVEFTVYPFIEIDKDEGAAGAEVTLSGTGWNVDEQEIEVRFYLEDPDGSFDDDDLYEVAKTADIDVSARGSWEGLTFTVPAASKGTHWIYAVGDETDDIDDYHIQGVQFEVTPGISMSPSSGAVGDTVTVEGGGFEADEEDITVLFDGESVATGITADEDGIWEATFEVPEATKGVHTITAEGEDTDSADVDDLEFEVLPTVSVSPTSGNVGTTVTVSGKGLPANKNVTVTYDGVNKASGTTGSNGSLAGVTFKATHTQDTHTVDHPIVVTYDGTTVSKTFKMESDAPTAPDLASPENGLRIGFIGDQTPTFTWAPVSDPSGVEYILQIANNPSCAQVLITKSGLSQPTYTLSKFEALGYGTYYWRVKAIDSAQNESNWSNIYSFKSGLLPMWAFIAIVGLVVVLIVFLVIYLVRGREPYD